MKPEKSNLFGIFNLFMLSLTVLLTAVILMESVFVIRTGEFLRPFPVVISTILLGALFLLLYKAAKARFLEKHDKKLIAALSAIYFLALFWFGNRLIVVPEYDLDLVQETAYMLALGERGGGIWHVYFARFTNQIPITLLLALFYKAGLLMGVTDYYIIGNFFNAMAISLTMGLGWLFARRHFDSAVSFIIYLFMICNPIWFLYVSWSSTDTFCLPFLMAGLLLLDNSLKGRFSYGRISAGAFLIAVSFTIRATNIILIIAYLIFISSRENWKKTLGAFLAIAAVFMLCSFGYHRLCDIYGAPYDTDERMPVTHWLMIGSNEESWGEFSSGDYEMDIVLPGYEERSEASREVFLERVKEMFPFRLIMHCMRKMAETWSSGYCIETTWQSVRAPGTVYEYTVGPKSALVQYLCQSFRVLLYLCLFILALYRLIKRKKEVRFLLTAWLGAMAFYILWEAGQRYSLSFVPWLSIAAGEVLELLKHRACRRL